jgi:hypothetical protein
VRFSGAAILLKFFKIFLEIFSYLVVCTPRAIHILFFAPPANIFPLSRAAIPYALLAAIAPRNKQSCLSSFSSPFFPSFFFAFFLCVLCVSAFPFFSSPRKYQLRNLYSQLPRSLHQPVLFLLPLPPHPPFLSLPPYFIPSLLLSSLSLNYSPEALHDH